MSADRELLGIVREIELVEEDIRDRNKAKSDIYKEAGDKGYDKKTIRKIVGARRLDASTRQDQDDLFDAYMQAIERAEKGITHARVEKIEQFDAETGEIFEPAPPPPGAETAGGLSEPLATGPVSPLAGIPPAEKAPEPAASPPVVGSGAQIQSSEAIDPVVARQETGEVARPVPLAARGSEESAVPFTPPAFLLKDHPSNPNCQKPATCKWARSMASCSACANAAAAKRKLVAA